MVEKKEDKFDGENVDKIEIAEQIAIKLKLSVEKVLKVINFQWEKMAEHIKNEEDEDFIIKYVGKIKRMHKPEKNELDLRDFDF
jgi:hypothetical protein